MDRPMEEAPQPRLALGPLEISLRRRGPDDVRRIGWPGSILTHVVILILWLVLTPFQRATPVNEVVPAPEPQVPVTFVDPFPRPAPAPPPRPAPPPSAAAKPLRMQAPQDETIAAKDVPKRATVKEIGRDDTKPAGGQSGGPLPDPTPGYPDETTGAAGSAPEQPKDLQGRLRDFRRALEDPNPGGKKGGGKGSGGLTMPDVPATGMGIGNLEFESRDYDWSSYARSIYWVIWRKWHMRLLASVSTFERWSIEHQRHLLDARSRIVFTIERSGHVSGVAVETASGCYPFDESATDTLNEVLLPPLPPDFPREQETVHATFVADDVEIPAMRSGLEYLRAQGIIY